MPEQNYVSRQRSDSRSRSGPLRPLTRLVSRGVEPGTRVSVDCVQVAIRAFRMLKCSVVEGAVATPRGIAICTGSHADPAQAHAVASRTTDAVLEADAAQPQSAGHPLQLPC